MIQIKKNSRIKAACTIAANLKSINKIVLLFVLSLMINNISAQDYDPITKEGARWIVWFLSNNSSWEDDTWEYYMTGDTIINDIEYKKVYWRDLVYNFCQPPFEPEGQYNLHGFIRDDTVNRKVYAINLDTDMLNSCPENEEYLMFDFSYQIGDTVDFCTSPQIYGIDTITDISNEIIYGLESKAFVLSYTSHSYYEGIGSEFGLFETMFVPLNKNTEYVTITYLEYYCPDDTCGLILSVPETEEKNRFTIYPNPVSDLLNIKFNNPVNSGFIKLFDIYGREVKSKYFYKNSSKIIIDVSDLKKGIYFAEIFDTDYNINKKKIIIN